MSQNMPALSWWRNAKVSCWRWEGRNSKALAEKQEINNLGFCQLLTKPQKNLKHLGDSVELSVYFEDNYLYTCVSSCRVVGGKNGKDALMVLTREGWEPFDFLF